MGIENFQFYHRLIEGDRTTNRCDRTTKNTVDGSDIWHTAAMGEN